MVRRLAIGAIVALSSARIGIAQSAPKAPSAKAPQTKAEKNAMLNDAGQYYWQTKAPATFIADVETTKGKIAIEFTRAWAPNGVDRFYNLARAGYYDDTRFYRVVYGFVAQFGIAANPAYANYWGRQLIKPDPVVEHNVRGAVSYAQVSPKDRNTNLFINLRDNLNLDTLGFTPVAHVVEGMDVADSLHSGYGDGPIMDPPFGDPKRMYRESNKYLDAKYPLLDKIIRVTIRP